MPCCVGKGAECGVAQGGSVGLCRGTVWGCTGTPRGGAEGRIVWPHRNIACSYVGAQRGTVQGHNALVCGGTVWDCAGTQGRTVWLRRNTTRGCAGSHRAATPEHSVLLHRATAGGSTGAQRGAVMGHNVRLRRVSGGLRGKLTTGPWRTENATSASPRGGWQPVGA